MLIFFTYKEDNDITNSLFQFEGHRYCSMFLICFELGKKTNLFLWKTYFCFEMKMILNLIPCYKHNLIDLC